MKLCNPTHQRLAEAQGAAAFFLRLRFRRFLEQHRCRHRHRQGSFGFAASEPNIETRFRFRSKPSIDF